VRNKELPEDIPEVALPSDLLRDGAVWIAKLITHCGFAQSTSEARRLVAQGAVSLDGEPIRDATANVTPRAGAVLKVGKRNYARLAR
jgi:tyrosyl-tRNA synthetase